MLPEALKLKLEFALGEIERELDSLSPLQKIAMLRPFDKIETLAAAAALHGLYSGMESMFNLIQKALDGRILPEGGWHRLLLDSMAKATSSRSAVLSIATVESLVDYLNFRHFFRHQYASRLDQQIVQAKFKSFPDVWKSVKEEILAFMKSESEV